MSTINNKMSVRRGVNLMLSTYSDADLIQASSKGGAEKFISDFKLAYAHKVRRPIKSATVDRYLELEANFRGIDLSKV